MDTTPAAPLARFRAELYQTGLRLRRDALFELLDAVLSGDGLDQPGAPQPGPVLSPRLGQCSLDVLLYGALDVTALRRLFARTRPPGPGRSASCGRWTARSGRVREPRPARSGPGSAS